MEIKENSSDGVKDTKLSSRILEDEDLSSRTLNTGKFYINRSPSKRWFRNGIHSLLKNLLIDWSLTALSAQ